MQHKCSDSAKCESNSTHLFSFQSLFQVLILLIAFFPDVLTGNAGVQSAIVAEPVKTNKTQK